MEVGEASVVTMNEFQIRISQVVSDLVGPVPDEITPAWLEDLWVRAEGEKRNGCPILMELGFITDEAERAAYWMKEQGREKSRFVASFRPNPFRSRQRVRLKKGSVVKQIGEEPRTLVRDQVITIDHTTDGYTDGYHGIHVHNPSIRWAGSGGYWVDLDLATNPIPEAA